jgi:nifR3 family TIM-barrel protein
MVASQEMVQAKPAFARRPSWALAGGLTAVQLAGREPRWMAEAARMVVANGARIIDINMGCPAKKVTTGWSGAALLREPDHALRLIEAVVGAVKVPVTLKTRLGWDDGCVNAAFVVRRAQEAGVRMVTIHGRTRCQFYKGSADWGAIRRIREVVTIPVIANGDIVDLSTAREALRQSGADGVMMGRGAQGRPWVPAQVAAGLVGAKPPQVPTGYDFSSMVSTHYEAMLSFYGSTLGSKVARKHLGWYMDTAGTSAALRTSVLTSPCPAQVLRLLPDALHREPAEVRAA